MLGVGSLSTGGCPRERDEDGDQRGGDVSELTRTVQCVHSAASHCPPQSQSVAVQSSRHHHTDTQPLQSVLQHGYHYHS